MPQAIRLRGVRVHNLRHIDVEIPLRKLTVITGVSGSGKSSLAFDTLYAEGQRRFLEGLSAYTRQFLDRLDKPDADAIDGLPPAIAIAARPGTRNSRSTVGTTVEIDDYLRLLYAKIGRVFCPQCDRPIIRDSIDTVEEAVARLAAGTRFLVGYPYVPTDEADMDELAQALKEDGFVRVLIGSRTVDLNTQLIPRPPANQPIVVIVDRLVAGRTPPERLADSIQTAFEKGSDRCLILIAGAGDAAPARPEERGMAGSAPRAAPDSLEVMRFSRRWTCSHCETECPEPEPRRFSFNSPLGACPECKGFGNVVDIDLDRVVPDPSKSIRDGAIGPWNTPAYRHELDELLALAPDYGLPVDVPFSRLTPEQVRLIQEGVPERHFGGLRGFFAWLERTKYKMPIRVFLSRWRTYRTCPACGGARLRPAALHTRIGGKTIAELSALPIRDVRARIEGLDLTEVERRIGRIILDQITSRLRYLESVGLDYLTLHRPTRNLSSGEAQRVALASALGSSLVNTLYVLDEPSMGLHPRDIERLIAILDRLRDRGNTVVVVEHDEAIIRAADFIIDIGPGAGDAGGRVVAKGPPARIAECRESATGDYLSGRRSVAVPEKRRRPESGWIRLRHARTHNLQGIDVDFPLGLLCVVTGVSGSGKSSLVQETLYPALCRRLHKKAVAPRGREPGLAAEDRGLRTVVGDGQIDDVVLVDQTPIGRSPRSNPVTYIKAFDEIRRSFAATVDAQARGLDAGAFSFNVEGGRCPGCAGSGSRQIDMQFLADLFVKCPDCNGTRYRPEILEITYRGKTIAEVLDLTVRQAFPFFRHQLRVQARLKLLMDVGLDYLRLGQPANTLSGGEAQRLKLASHMSTGTRSRCLFLLDEPTTGLHFADVIRLLDCLTALVALGHSLVVVEHNLDVIKCADYLIDLGPEAGDAGGRVVATGTPEEVARVPGSSTGQRLAPLLAQAKRLRQGA